jgi:hypothetical protein
VRREGRLPRSRPRAFCAAGYIADLDQPQAFCRAIADFLKAA